MLNCDMGKSMLQEQQYVLKGKLGMLLPVVCLIVLGAAMTIASYGYGEGGTKFKVIGPMCLFFAVAYFFGNTKITISENAVAAKNTLLGVPFISSVHDKTSILRMNKTADGIEIYDQSEKLVRTLEGFDDQQQLDEIYAALQEWHTTN